MWFRDDVDLLPIHIVLGTFNNIVRLGLSSARARGSDIVPTHGNAIGCPTAYRREEFAGVINGFTVGY